MNADYTLEGYERRLLALRKAARYRNPDTGRQGFAHNESFRSAFVRGILEHRDAIRRLKSEN